MKAILTGHTRGLGAAIAEELLDRHIPVLGLARHHNADLAQRFPVGLAQVELDLADTGSLEDWLAGDTLATFLAGSPSAVLINNAGVVQPVGPLTAQDVVSIARAVSINVTAPLVLSRAIMMASPSAQDRRILHLSSGAARNAYPGWSIYCATKAALDHHARAVALDKLPGVRICSLAPGVIDTDMQAEIRSTSLDNFPLRERFEAMKRDGALTEPADCARRLVDYLVSERFGNEPVADLRDF
ncbi:MAG TPA: SDR family oxidoreductase [Noviherbaspirillum sp.]|nr:SDR family oxidoreductase [Noviherbaspirillum sp.]